MTQEQIDAINSGITRATVESMVIPSYTQEGYAENAVRADTATMAEAAMIALEADTAKYAPDYTPLSTFNQTLGNLASIIHEI